MAIDLSKYKIMPSVDLSKYRLDIPQQSLGDKIWSDLAQRGKGLEEEVTKLGQTPIVGGLKATAQAFGGIGDVVGEILKATPIVAPVVEKVGELTQRGFSKLVDYASPMGQKLAKLEQTKPEQAKVIIDFLEGAAAAGEISGNILLTEGLRRISKELPSTTKTIVTKGGELYKTLTAQSEKQIESSIIKTFEKGVKPLSSGKTTSVKAAAYKEDIVDAVKTIKENKSNLQYKDELGDIITGETPKSLQQFSEAIDQTKKTIFTKYDTLAKEAGQKGLEIDTPTIVNELNSIINNKALSLTNPRAIQYAKDIQIRYKNIGNIDAETAQEVIKNYNNSLDAFYKNPTYDSASQAAIDALVANRIRVALDEGITGITGEQYQILKNQYGALKNIERDVVKATLRDARKNVKGLVDFSDIFTGGQVVSGILNLNPAQIVSGVTAKGIAEWIKYLNNPNRAIESLFKTVEKLPIK